MAGKTTSRSSRRRSAAGKRWHSRAVLRPIEAGNSAECALCGDVVKFRAKVKHKQVICNVYVKGVWDRVEHYHAECYDQAGAPYGSAAA